MKILLICVVVLLAGCRVCETTTEEVFRIEEHAGSAEVRTPIGWSAAVAFRCTTCREMR